MYLLFFSVVDERYTQAEDNGSMFYINRIIIYQILKQHSTT